MKSTLHNDRATALLALFGAAAALLGGALWPQPAAVLFCGAALAALAMLWLYLRRERQRREMAEIEARKRADQAELELVLSERRRFENDAYQDFSRKLLVHADLESLIDEIFDYVATNFGIEACLLYLYDADRNELFHFRSRFPDYFEEPRREWARQLRVSLAVDSSIHYAVVPRRKPFYLPHIRSASRTLDIEATRNMKLQSLLMIPLFVRNDLLGVIDFTNYERPLRLNREDIDSVAAFCAQIAGAVKSLLLIREAEQARNQALQLKNEAERRGVELERHAAVTRQVNAETNLDAALDVIFEFIRAHYDVNAIWLQFPDPEANELYTYRAARPEGMADEAYRHVLSLRIPLGEQGSIAQRVYVRRRAFYLPHPPDTFFSEIDRQLFEMLALQSAFCAPLVIGEESIGVIILTKIGGKQNLSRDDIRSLGRFCDQIAGAINKARIHTESEISRLVAEQRLEEVQMLKQQQDLDYYLTANLLIPLSQVAGTRTIAVESFVRQKKRFPFKRWICEIGGDLNVATPIVIGGERYLFFCNADAMGKSIQGAGGALVLASALRTLLERPADPRHVAEQWLSRAYTELDRVFRNFDGSMYITFVIGLLHENSGWTYWLNGEHPPPVLVHAGGAELIRGTSMHKLGFRLGARPVAVNMLRLQPGDALVLGSDGRDDILQYSGGVQVMNDDELKFVESLKIAGPTLESVYSALRERGGITDDLSLLRIDFAGLPPEAVHEWREPELSAILDHYIAGQSIDGERLAAAASRALEIGPPPDAARLQGLNRLLLQYVRGFLAEDRADRALQAANHWLQWNPGADELLAIAAQAAARLGLIDDALALVERAVLRQPSDPECLRQYVERLLEAGDREEARLQFERLRDLKPPFTEELAELSRRLDRAGRS